MTYLAQIQLFGDFFQWAKFQENSDDSSEYEEVLTSGELLSQLAWSQYPEPSSTTPIAY